MTNNILFTAIACASICSTFISCKKNDVPKPTCKIITVTPVSSGSGTDLINFSYNSEGKLNSISQGTSTTTLTYSGSTEIANITNSGVFSSKNIITLNTNGLASNIRTENDETGTSWSNQAFEYSGTELIKSTRTGSAGGPPSISTITWSGGNMVTITSGSSTTTLDYFTDKPAQAGDYLQIAQLLSGYEIYRSKNILKSISSDSDISNFDYTFDADGKITSMAVTGSSATTFNYQYQCNN